MAALVRGRVLEMPARRRGTAQSARLRGRCASIGRAYVALPRDARPLRRRAGISNTRPLLSPPVRLPLSRNARRLRTPQFGPTAIEAGGHWKGSLTAA